MDSDSAALPAAGATPKPQVQPQPRRDAHIDALRGFALFGILIVNLMSFTSGLSGPSLGVLTESSTLADHIVLVLVAFLGEFKFYPIFAFLFGYGFLKIWRRARASGADVDALYSRRLWFLGLLGAFHGIFIWFGDILSRYAVVAIFLRKRLAYRPRQLLRSIRNWLLLAVGIGVVFAVVGVIDSPPGNGATNQTPIVSVYATGGFLAVTAQRLQDYLAITIMFVFLVPQVMVIFLLGVLVARMGWIDRPARHHAFWRKVLVTGLVVGLPVNALWAWLQWHNAVAFNPALTMWMPLLDLLMPFQAAAMVALLMINLERPTVQCLVALLAHAGRMPLTNYLAQSVVCSFVLYGYGLGLGQTIGQAGLAALAIGVYVTQIVVSPWWLARHDTGPMETWWRRHVYGRPAEKGHPTI